MSFSLPFFPALNIITAATNSYPSIFQLFLPVNYVVDQYISFRCPPAFGMVEINGLRAKVLAVNPGASTITMDLDTTGFSAFTFPVLFTQLPLTVPAGEFNTLAAAIRDNKARPGYTPV